MNLRRIKIAFYQPLFAVLVLTLLVLFPLRSWAVQSTPEQTSEGKTTALKTPEIKQEIVKNPGGKKFTAKTSKRKPASRKVSGRKALTLTAKARESKTVVVKFAPPETIIFPILQYEIPRAERIVLDNGMILFLIEDHELPLVSISAVVRTGAAYDPPEKEGLAELTGRAMRTGGTTALTGDAMDDRLDHYAINIWTNVDTEVSRFGLSALKENLEMGVDLFSQILQSPRFEPQKVQTEKDLLKEGLRRIEDDPQEYAFREFRKHLYQGNPRGNQKTIASVDKIQISDLTGFHQKYFSPRNMMLAVTGDITREEAVPLLSRYFGPAPRNEKPESLSAPLIRGDGKVILVPKETPQSIVLMGFSAPPKNSPDYFAFSILDFVLGSGGFRSRIFQEIRNNQGLAYSAGSFYKAREDYGVLSTYGMTKADSTMKVLDAMKSIITEVASNPLKSEEINWAKKSITNSFLFSFVSAEQIAYQQLTIEYDGLPADFLQNYRDKIQRVGSGQIQPLAKKYLRPDQATVLILGDEKRFDRPAH
jgi:zinc protease